MEPQEQIVSTQGQEEENSRKGSRLDAPAIKEAVVKRLAAGESQSSIAREVGLHPSQVCRFANSEDVKKMVEEQTMSFLEAVPDAVQNVKDLVKEMPEIPKEETKRRELSLKASLKVLEAPGIVNTTTPSQTFLNITKTDNLILLPAVAAIIREHLGKSIALAGHKEGDGGEKKAGTPGVQLSGKWGCEPHTHRLSQTTYSLLPVLLFLGAFPRIQYSKRKSSICA